MRLIGNPTSRARAGTWLALTLVLAASSISVPAQEASASAGRREVIAVVGAPGEPAYDERFREAAEAWKEACGRGEAGFTLIGGGEADAEALKTRLEALRNASPPVSDLWLVLIGHGTFDGRETKFAVGGPDFTDKDLAGWLRDFPCPVVVVNTASSSAPFLNALSGPDRVVITATKSASEIYYARFGEFFAQAIAGAQAADLDNDAQVSLLEAYLFAAQRVAAYYADEGRIATEHALLDDNGDTKGTRAEWFEGVRAVKTPAENAAPDGERAAQLVLVPSAADAGLPAEVRQRRSVLETELRALVREREGGQLAEEAFYQKAETILLELAAIAARTEPVEAAPADAPTPPTD